MAKKKKIEDLVQAKEEKKEKKKNPLYKKILLYAGIVVGAIVLIITVIFLVRLIVGTSIPYPKIEEKMEEAAREYFSIHTYLLPEEIGGEATVNISELITAELIDPLDKMLKKGVTCEANVIVSKLDQDSYAYTPYLDCGEHYYSRELYKKMLEDHPVVTNGKGLYQMGTDYVFRGEVTSNYVDFAGKLWRAVKVTNQNYVELIQIGISEEKVWDNRFNVIENDYSGINEYYLSRIFEYLEKLYQDEKFLSSKDKEKIVNTSLCVGKRSRQDAVNDGSIECSARMENQPLGLLPLFDYINASLDPTCHKQMDTQCLNYNYMANYREDWWLLTANSQITNRAYRIEDNGRISNSITNREARVRPVLYLSNRVMISGGDGTKDNPYKVR